MVVVYVRMELDRVVWTCPGAECEYLVERWLRAEKVEEKP